jgi:CO/xanthine dehydrogenase Mo-binding subunit
MELPEFVDDILHSPEGGTRGFFAVLIRSPSARGVLAGIEAPPLPSPVWLIRAADIPGKNSLDPFCGAFPVLAQNEVSYIGEPVAILAGPDMAELLELAGKCRVLVEERKAVFDPFTSEQITSEQSAAERSFVWGDAKNVFRQAETGEGNITLVEGKYHTGFQEAWGADPNGAVAFPRTNGMLIRTAAQWPSLIVNSVARVLGIDPGRVELRRARLAHHLDGKLLYPALCSCHAALAAWFIHRPVKFILGRSEDVRFSPKRVKMDISLKSAVSGGRILATEVRINADMGAFPCFAGEILDRAALGTLGAYHHGTIALDARAFPSNIPPSGPLSGFGLAQGFFAAERHASRIADAIREDPSEWRKNVFFQKGMKLAAGNEIREPVCLEGLVDTAASMSDYRRKWAAFELLRQHRRIEGFGSVDEPLRGIGMAAAFQGSGFMYPLSGKQGIEITLEKDGSLEIKTSIVSEGQIFPWKAIAARELGVDEQVVRIVTEGSGIPDSGPSCLSRNITVMTRLVERCCQAIKKQRFRDPLPITIQRFYTPARAGAWASSQSYDENSFSCLSWAAAVVQTEIDPAEYIPRVKGIWLAVDGGPILAEKRARGRLTLLSIQALNWASRERLSYRDGIIPLEQIRDYPLPLSREIPPVRIDFQWSEGAPRGIGELPFNTIPAAYVQAVSQALDHPFEELPVSSADIWSVIKSRETEGQP